MLGSLIEKWKQMKSQGSADAVTLEGPLTENSNADAQTVSCSTHGNSQATFVCKHLIEDPMQRWHCGYPEEEEPWRDAWCDECHVAFEREGEWNERNEKATDIKLLCSSCYDEMLGQSVGRLADDALAAWEAYSNECCRLLSDKQDEVCERYQLDRYPRWDYDQQSARLIFTGADTPDLIVDVEFVGTLSTTNNTWKWAWANFSLLASVRSLIVRVRDFGEAHNYPHLTVPMWSADQADGWHMAGIAVAILGAHGVYRAPTDNGYIFMAMMGMHYAQ